ncbi:two-component system sensor kinase [Escherichia coli]|uniref:Two-component system sensor kinase n=1 Tax=Escherichia coli TaxID=562 RepID=A0A376W744_ECOLX|nr:two-component system sensor kinase [Escherichia coli]
MSPSALLSAVIGYALRCEIPGTGIDPKVIERVEANEMPGNKIGLLNVHHRVKLLYGEGLHIRRLEPGTEIAFYIPNQRTPVASQATLLL